MRGRRRHSSTLPSAVVLSTDARTMGNDPSVFKHADGEELSTPPPPPPGAALIQDREYGALGLAKLRTFLIDTPEVIAAKERLKATWGGWCPPWGGHTY